MAKATTASRTPGSEDVAAFLEERGSRWVARLGRLEDALAHPALIAEHEDANRLWVLTTNDNLDALRVGAVDDARRALKPEIPEDGDHGIPIRDELILEKEVAR